MIENTDDCNQIDALEADYLYIQLSQLPDSGNGLFSTIDIYKDEIISVFKGEILTQKQAKLRAKNNQDQYFINRIDGSILDSKKTKCFAKYANDAKGFTRSLFTNNAKIALDENNNICLIATRKIKTGEEIFCDYGKKYWANQEKIKR